MVVAREDFERIFLELLDSKRPVILSPRGRPISFLCTPVGIVNDSVIFKNSIPVDLLPDIITSTEFMLVCKDFQLVSAALFAHGTEIRFPMHHISLLPQSRVDERIVFSTNDQAEVTINHPFDAGTNLTRHLYDLSNGGLSFRARIHTKLMQPGRIFSHMKVRVKDREEVVRHGRVVYIKQIFEENGHHFHQVGVQFIRLP